jgi:hypothetical protein
MERLSVTSHMKPELARQNTGNAGSICYHYNPIENESVKGLPPFLSLLLMHHRVRSCGD